MGEIRDSTKGDFKDILIISFDNSGNVKNAIVFTSASLAANMLLSENAIV